MLERSFGLMFYLKVAKNPRDSQRYVYLKITVNGVNRDVSVKRQWCSVRWNSDLGRATGSAEDARELNSYLDLLTAKIYQAKKRLMDEDKEVTADAIKNVLTGRDNEERHMILEAFKYHNAQMKALIGTDFAKSTLIMIDTAAIASLQSLNATFPYLDYISTRYDS